MFSLVVVRYEQIKVKLRIHPTVCFTEVKSAVKAGFPLGGLERADNVLRISIGWRFKNARQSRSEFDFRRKEQNRLVENQLY